MTKNLLPILITIILALVPYNNVFAASGEVCEIGTCLPGSLGIILLIIALGLAFGASIWLRNK